MFRASRAVPTCRALSRALAASDRDSGTRDAALRATPAGPSPAGQPRGRRDMFRASRAVPTCRALSPSVGRASDRDSGTRDAALRATPAGPSPAGQPRGRRDMFRASRAVPTCRALSPSVGRVRQGLGDTRRCASRNASGAEPCRAASGTPRHVSRVASGSDLRALSASVARPAGLGTCDPRLRRAMLYPTELRARAMFIVASDLPALSRASAASDRDSGTAATSRFAQR